MWNPHQLVADDGSTEIDIEGMAAGKDQFPSGLRAVADLSAGGKKIMHCKAIIETTTLE